MMNHFAVSFLAAAGMLTAGQPPKTFRPPDLNQLSKEQFQQLLSKALGGGSQPGLPLRRMTTARNDLCSIPLLDAKVKHPERFSMPKLPVGRANLDPMATPPPAPACKSWNEGK